MKAVLTSLMIAMTSSIGFAGNPQAILADAQQIVQNSEQASEVGSDIKAQLRAALEKLRAVAEALRSPDCKMVTYQGGKTSYYIVRGTDRGPEFTSSEEAGTYWRSLRAQGLCR